MLIYQPIKAILSTPATFKPFKSEGKTGGNSLLMPQLVFCLMQLALLAMGVWKCSSMGLIPSTESDWLSFQPVPEFPEYSHVLV